uniref:Uncharacterized protein n=1 Tax=Aegilops tauschii TaxID=37682 RepID=R7WEP5_AEGTA
MPFLRTPILGLVAVNSRRRRPDEMVFAGIRMHLRLGRRNRLPESTEKPLVGQKGLVPMAFGGTQEPAAYGELVSIEGLNPDVNKKLSADIASITSRKRAFSPDSETGIKGTLLKPLPLVPVLTRTGTKGPPRSRCLEVHL